MSNTFKITEEFKKGYEHKLQAYAVQRLKTIDRDIVIIANPHSSKRNAPKNMTHHQRIRYFQKVETENKAQGFQAGQSDLIIHHYNHFKTYPSLTIELKTLDENPFRPYRRNKDRLWIKETTEDEGNHVMQQLDFLARISSTSAAFLCAGTEMFNAVFEWYFYGKKLADSGYTQKVFEFMYGYAQLRRFHYLEKIA